MFSITSCDYKVGYNHPYYKLTVNTFYHSDYDNTRIIVRAIVCDRECRVSLMGEYFGDMDMEQIELDVRAEAKDIAYKFGRYLEPPYEAEVETHTIVVGENCEGENAKTKGSRTPYWW